jgi:hypothetical protein
MKGVIIKGSISDIQLINDYAFVKTIVIVIRRHFVTGPAVCLSVCMWYTNSDPPIKED